ncbi:MAG TPA: threonine/serine dehydratase [Candidatus Dormibacteraeota bacterium]|nr:threonine/serine dehydratase [Candidatus Dormibacteraeota bacterium]
MNDVKEIQEARERIRPHVRRTPLLRTDLDDRLRLKAECFQLTGSFKARGAFNAVLAKRAADPSMKGVIAVSSGNHAQALALAARSAGLKAVIIIPADANPEKVQHTRDFGAHVIQDGVTFANREQRLREEMEGSGLVLVHPFNDWDVIHGQGTVAMEMLDDDPAIEMIVTPCGGGGLLSGTALWTKHAKPGSKVIGVEPAAADDASRSLHSGRLVRLDDSPVTLADGVRALSMLDKTFEVIVTRGLVDDIVTVTEDEIAEAVRVAWFRLHLALEPTGALPLAAFLAGKLPAAPSVIGLVMTGGNADRAVVSRLLAST